MTALVSLFVVVGLSVTITRIASVALTHTGLSREAARFQARSAFTGVGFTTTESEKVVNHPVRRRVLMALMLAGNVGIVTAISTFILSFIGLKEAGTLTWRLFALFAGLTLMWLAARSEWIDARMSWVIHWAINRYTSLKVKDYASLLHLSGDYEVSELEVREGSWLEGKALRELNLLEEGVVVLGVKRSTGRYLGTPGGATEVRAGDVLLLYGREESIDWLQGRLKGTQGDREHEKAVSEQEAVKQREEREDVEAHQRQLEDEPPEKS